MNSLEHFHVTILDSSINDAKPSTSSQITKPITSNNNRVKNKNSYKMKKKKILLHHLSLRKAFKNVSNADIDSATSTINSNINIPYRFRKSTTMEHYSDEPNHVPSYQKNKYRTDSMGFLNHVEILRNFTKKYGLPLPQYTVYPDPNSKTKSFFLAQININEHFVIQSSPTSELAESRAALKLLLLLMRSYDLCDEDFYNTNGDNKNAKNKKSKCSNRSKTKINTLVKFL